ncbi:MAG: class I SAM-dependent rRNA methyltransferase [candidate division Zixibacteria bacterium]|nr:class I SAM-dependent rRNA methyltransferase [candidate division Zixibacteria bacterium]
MYPNVKLRPGKETTVQQRHPWVFSGALAEPIDERLHGALVQVIDSRDNILGVGTCSRSSSIAVRIFDFSPAQIDTDWLVRRITAAHEQRLRLGYGPDTATTGYRVVFGESDGIPGLVIDRYDSAIVLQLSTAGLERLRPKIIDAVTQVFAPPIIVERSDVAVRKDDLLAEYSTVHRWNGPAPITIIEDGIKYQVDLVNGQKTGFYLDQREFRRMVRSLAEGRKVLNLFSYTGSIGVAALIGGAGEVLNIDSSEVALSQCPINAELNGLPKHKMHTEADDVFQFLSRQSEPGWDMVVIDPPALIKSQRNIEAGRKAYHFLYRAAMRLLNPDGIFACSSCSQFFSADDMAITLRRASVQNGVSLFPIKVLGHPDDHPVSLYFPESSYLKSFICSTSR